MTNMTILAVVVIMPVMHVMAISALVTTMAVIPKSTVTAATTISFSRLIVIGKSCSYEYIDCNCHNKGNVITELDVMVTIA